MATDPLWLPTLSLDETELRRLDSPLVMSDGTALGSRAGVRPGDPGLTVTLSGSTINVSTGVATLYRSGQGVYRAWTPATTSTPSTVAAAHATFVRIDLVYLRVWDSAVDASGLRKADVVYLAGTASASPTAPTPGGTEIYIPIATITVPASGGGSPVVSTAIRPNTVAPGGILPVSSAADLALVGSYVGQTRYNTVRGCPEYWTGSAWLAQGDYASYTPTWTGSTANPTVGNAVFAARWGRTGGRVHAFGTLTLGSTTVAATGLWALTLPVASAANLYVRGTGTYVKPGDMEYPGIATIDPLATSMRLIVKTQVTYQFGNVSDSIPTPPGAGVIVSWNIEYEGV